MEINAILFLWILSLLAASNANRLAGGHTLLFYYYAYKIDFLTLQPGGTTTICPDLVSTRGAGQLAYFDEFVKHIYPSHNWNQYNSRQLGRTTNPPPSWGFRELAADHPQSFRKDGVPALESWRLIPSVDRTGIPPNGGVPFQRIISTVTAAVQNARARPAKPGVDRTQMLGEMRKCGDAAAEARWRDIQAHKIKDFNDYCEEGGSVWRAATHPKTISDGTVIDQFDTLGTMAQTQDPEQRKFIFRWSAFYGTDRAYFWQESKESRDAWRQSKSHKNAQQLQIRANRQMASSRFCGF